MKHSSLQDAYAGQFYQDKPSLNTNTLLNFVLSRPVGIQTHSTANIEQEVQFPDVSFYQEEINYSVMRLQTDTIIIRIGQNLWPDDQLERNYLEAKKRGMKVGGYWFYDDRISPRKQAELLIALCMDKTFELEIFIDWEVSYGGGFRGLQNVVAMMEVLDAAISIGILRAKNIGFYTGYYFFRGNSNPITHVSQYNYLKNKPLWLAWYTNNPANVLIPAPWVALTLWQWGTPAWDWGQATKEIDMNWFNGTKQEFEVRYGISEEPMADYVELKSNLAGQYRSIRRPVAYPQIPHIAGAFFARLESGQTIQLPIDSAPYTYAGNIRYEAGGTVYEAFAGDKWWKVSAPNGEDGWIAEIHKGIRYLDVKIVNNPDPVTSLPTLVVEVSDTQGLYIPVTVELKPK